MPGAPELNMMDRVRAARMLLAERDVNVPFTDPKQAEMEAFMAIFHPGHKVPKKEEG